MMSAALRVMAAPVRETAGTSADSAAVATPGRASPVAATRPIEVERKSRLFMVWPRPVLRRFLRFAVHRTVSPIVGNLDSVRVPALAHRAADRSGADGRPQ